MVRGMTGPPLKTGSPVGSWRTSLGRLRITPTVLESSVWVTSTTVSLKLGSASSGLATSSTPLGACARHAAEEAASSSDASARRVRTAS